MAQDLSEKELLRMEVEQLKKEVKNPRDLISKTGKEIKDYVEAQAGTDPLLKGIPEDKNPFKEKGTCVLSWWPTLTTITLSVPPQPRPSVLGYLRTNVFFLLDTNKDAEKKKQKTNKQKQWDGYNITGEHRPQVNTSRVHFKPQMQLL